MKYNPDIHKRKSIRLKDYDYSSNGAYFITICVKNRECLFGEIINDQMVLSEAGLIAYNNWNNIAEHCKNIQIDEFIIMPNHIHGIVLIDDNQNTNDLYKDDIGLGVIYNATTGNKIESDNEIVKNKYYSNLSPSKNSLSIVLRTYKASVTRECKKNNSSFEWQRNYYEWIIRNENQLEKVREYIKTNPLKWSLDRENPNNYNKN